MRRKLERSKIHIKGVHQWSLLFPYIFNSYVQEAINNITEFCQVGINKHGETIDMLKYADDTAIVSENQHDLQNLLERRYEILRIEDPYM